MKSIIVLVRQCKLVQYMVVFLWCVLVHVHYSCSVAPHWNLAKYWCSVVILHKGIACLSYVMKKCIIGFWYVWKKVTMQPPIFQYVFFGILFLNGGKFRLRHLTVWWSWGANSSSQVQILTVEVFYWKDYFASTCGNG